MKHCLIAALNLFSFCLLAQDETWYDGMAVTSDNQVIIGKVMVHAELDLIVVSHNGQRDVLPAHMLTQCRYFDAANKVNRRFVSVRVEHEARLYEVVLAGEVSVLRKPSMARPATVLDADAYDYYFQYDGELHELRKFRKLLYPSLQVAVGSRVRASHLDPFEPADILKLIRMYNECKYELIASR